MIIVLLQSMSYEACYVGEQTALSTDLQQRYDQLQAPQCTNSTYINVFINKLLPMYHDADIREILCHLWSAVSQLDRIHVRKNNTNHVSHRYILYCYRVI